MLLRKAYCSPFIWVAAAFVSNQRIYFATSCIVVSTTSIKSRIMPAALMAVWKRSGSSRRVMPSAARNSSLQPSNPGMGSRLNTPRFTVMTAARLSTCNVQQASVAELPFEAEQFDVVTAFETVYFWPELAQNFREVYRVLKPGGTFFICNEANGETAKDDKWTQIINGMTIYTDADLKVYLEQAGFGRVQSHKNKKGWLCVTAQK